MYDKRLLHSQRGGRDPRRRTSATSSSTTRIRKTDPLRGGAREGPVRARVRARPARRPRCTATWRRRCSMARKRASMREGPLAELFRATEAAQRQRGAQAATGEPAAGAGEATVERTCRRRTSTCRARSRAAGPRPHAEPPEPEPEPASRAPRRARAAADRVPRRAAGRALLEPLPEPAPRLHRAPRGDSAAYLAVIRVVGVGGAGLNAIDRMMDAGHQPGRVRRGQHRPAAAADERTRRRRSTSAASSPRASAPAPTRSRQARRGGVLRPDQAARSAAPTWCS